MAHGRQRFFRRVVAHRRAVAALSALLVAVSAWIAGGVPIDYGMEQFFPSEGPERATFDEYRGLFSKEDAQVALFFADEDPLDIEAFRDLEAAASLFRGEGLEDVRWFGNLDLTETIELDGEETTRIYRLVDEPDADAAALREEVRRRQGDPLLDGIYWNAEQTVFTVYGYLAPEDNTDARRREIEQRLTAGLAALEAPGRTLTLTGIPVFRSRIPAMLETDQSLFLGGGFVLFCLILFYFFRNPWHVALCMSSVVPGYLATVALIGLTGRSISILTSFIPIVVLVVGVSDAIHVLDRYRANRSTREDHDDAVVETFVQLSGPCLYTSLTTALGFATLVGTRIGMVAEFGVFTGLGIMLTYAFAMTLLPALLGFSARLTFNDRGLRPAWMRGTLDLAVRVRRERPALAVLVFALLGVGGLAAGSTLRVNTFMLDDMEDDSDVVRDLDRVEALGFGLFQVNVFVRGDGTMPLHAPPMLAWMEAVEEEARRDPLVVNAVGPPDVIAGLRQGLLGTPDRALPASGEEAAQLLFLASMDGSGEIEDVYLQDADAAQIVLTVRDEGSTAMLPFLQGLERSIAENPPPAGEAAVTGTVMMAQTYTTRLVRTFGPSLALAVALIFAVMVHMFRSVRVGLLGLIPNVFPLLLLLVAMALLGIDLKPSTILVFSIAFGLAVDDTIHFLSHLRTELAEAARPGDAVEESIRSTGPAILMTSVAMAGGFVLLAASQFQVLVLVGVMTAVGVVSAVFADLFALPSIIALTRGTLLSVPSRAPSPEVTP